ncbi:MAG: 4-hydroxybutyrate--acetyl-CoA CoA transferase [Reyranella sp.]|jgi:itaconate CoA-transferase|nr:4-hydroxybutyrate--acetyl-CoA CoA transferase [Reyranella sp.]
MPTVTDIYKSKLATAADALKGLPRKSTVVLGFFASQPPALVAEMGMAIAAGTFDEVRMIYMHATEATGAALLKAEYCDVLKLRPFYMGPAERALVQSSPARKLVHFIPIAFSETPRAIRAEERIDAFPVQVSPMDRAGYFSLGLTGAYSQAALERADRIIVEVNPSLPRTFGAGLLHVSDVDTIVEGSGAVPTLAHGDAGPDDEAISDFIVPMIPDRACVQFGIGGVPNLVASRLTGHKDLGVHSELLSDGIADLVTCGAVTNRFKQTNPGKTVFNVAMGSRALYDLMNDNPTMECWPADYVNDPRIIGQNDNFTSVNAMIEIDLTGQVNAEYLMHHQFSAVGGQLDFVRGARYSRGGRSIIASPSTAAHGKVSRIVPRLQGPATDPRIETQYIVTEYGAFNLQGKSSDERAMGLIGLAHPSFREKLTADARELHLIE